MGRIGMRYVRHDLDPLIPHISEDFDGLRKGVLAERIGAERESEYFV
jgi:hypothetical protein